jgi:hypothetical protein
MEGNALEQTFSDTQKSGISSNLYHLRRFYSVFAKTDWLTSVESPRDRTESKLFHFSNQRADFILSLFHRRDEGKSAM